MAASSIISFIITARSTAGSVFSGIISSLSGMGRAASSASGSTGSLTGSIVSGILQANLLGQALNAVGNGAQFMMGKFEEAKKIEIGDVSAASTFSALTKQSFGDSTKFVSDFSKEIAVIAGTLPGATRDYNMVANSIMDNVIPAFKGADGVLDQGKFKENLVDITKKMTLMGVNSGTQAQAVGMFTARLLDGNIASAKNLLFADNNPAFMGQLKAALEKQGKTEKDFKTMTAKQRLEMIQAVSSEFISDEVIQAASNTVDGLLAGIESSIFDPKSGVFGLLRDISDVEGNQTVMSAVASGIKAVQDFFDTGAKLFSALGVPPIDPMLVLYNGINTITDWVKQTAAIIRSITSVAKSGGGGLKGLEALATKYLNPDFLVQKISPLIARISAFVTPIFQKYLNPEFILKGLSGLATTGLKILAPLAQKFLNPETLLKNFQLLLDGVSGWLNSLFAGLASGSGQLLAGGKGAAILAVVGAKVGWFAGELIWRLIDFVIKLPWGDILITIGNIAILVIPAIIAAVLAFQARVVGAIAQGVWEIGAALIKGLNDVWLGTTFTFSPMVEKTNSGINYFWNGWGEVSAGNALSITYNSGVVLLPNGNQISIAPATITVSNNVVTWVYVNSEGNVTISTTQPLLALELAKVTTVSGVVTAIEDRRPRFIVFPSIKAVKIFGGSGDQGDYTLSGTATFDQGEYYFKNFTISASATATIKGIAKIYVAGDCTIAGTINVLQAANGGNGFGTTIIGGAIGIEPRYV